MFHPHNQRLQSGRAIKNDWARLLPVLLPMVSISLKFPQLCHMAGSIPLICWWLLRQCVSTSTASVLLSYHLSHWHLAPVHNPQWFHYIQRWWAPILLEDCPCQILCDLLPVEQSISLLLCSSWHRRWKEVRAKMLSVTDWIHVACHWLWAHTLLQKTVSVRKVLWVLCSKLWCFARWQVYNSICGSEYLCVSGACQHVMGLASVELSFDALSILIKRLLCRNAPRKCPHHVRTYCLIIPVWNKHKYLFCNNLELFFLNQDCLLAQAGPFGLCPAVVWI